MYTFSGAVYTCGLNDAHQLGHGSNPTSAPSDYLAPKQVRIVWNKHSETPILWHQPGCPLLGGFVWGCPYLGGPLSEVSLFILPTTFP